MSATRSDDTSSAAQASTVWLEVVAAVDFLGEHHRPGLTVWSALEEAVRWWAADFVAPPGDSAVAVPADLPWNDPDPLRSSMERLLATVGGAGVPDGHAMDDVLTAALSVWLRYMSNSFNEGHRFAHPAPRTGWPAAAL